MTTNPNYTPLDQGDLVKVHEWRPTYTQSVSWHNSYYHKSIGLSVFKSKTPGQVHYVPYESIAIVIKNCGIQGVIIFWDMKYLRAPEFLLEKVL